MVIKDIILKIVDVAVAFYPMRLKNKMEYFHSVFHNHWIKRYVGSLGEKSSIGIDCQLQGRGVNLSR